MVEDNRDDVLLMKRTLAKLNFEYPLYVVADAEEAVSYLAGNGKFVDRSQFPFPRVIISDMTLPRKSGLTILEWLRNHPDCLVIPTIIMTSDENPHSVSAAYRMGANAYLIKPGSLRELEALMELAIRFWCKCTIPPYPKNC
jgi:CheY-like chemotaxis protein